jgi:hypothetical protein
MRRFVMSVALTALAAAMLAGGASAAQKDACPSGEWKLWPIYSENGDIGVADYFWPHLLNDLYGFADAAEFAQVLDDLYDKNGDDMVCGHERGGYELNPKSHWYRLGIELIGEPVHFISIKDNASNGTK